MQCLHYAKVISLKENGYKMMLLTGSKFEELYYFMNDLIVKKGFINLDFLGNLGHSIVKHKNDRIYTEKGNHKRLSDVEMFTFEPHISIPDSEYGYKREDIYYFENGKLIKL